MLLGVRAGLGDELVARRPPAAHLRAVRRALVRVLAAAPPGEPEDRRLRRRRHVRPAAAAVATAARDLGAGRGLPRRGLGGARVPRPLRRLRRRRARAPQPADLGGDRGAAGRARARRSRGRRGDGRAAASGSRPAKLGVTGEDAVEIALRTALLATGRPGIVAFDGAYHGTGLLALAATAFEHFREPFAAWLPGPVHRFAVRRGSGPAAGGRGLRDRRARAGARRARASRRTAFLRAAAGALRRGRRAADRATRSTAGLGRTGVHVALARRSPT